MTKTADDPLRARLKALPPPSPSAALRDRLLDDATRRLSPPKRWWQPVWRPALALAVVVLASAVGFREYVIWQELQMLAELDSLSAATLLLL